MRILVCGGRDFGDLQTVKRGTLVWRHRSDEYKFIVATLDRQASETAKRTVSSSGNWMTPEIEVIAGAARGADTVAADWARDNKLKLLEFPADWKKHGKSAGYVRNKQMLDEGKPDIVIAFPGGHGTKNMKNLARIAGVPVIEVKYERVAVPKTDS